MQNQKYTSLYDTQSDSITMSQNSPIALALRANQNKCHHHLTKITQLQQRLHEEEMALRLCLKAERELLESFNLEEY